METSSSSFIIIEMMEESRREDSLTYTLNWWRGIQPGISAVSVSNSDKHSLKPSHSACLSPKQLQQNGQPSANTLWGHPPRAAQP